jgi:hypothetical protein
VDLTFDGYELDTLRFPHDKGSFYTHLIDDYVVAKADSCIRASAPDLSWIYLEHTDDMGHRYGDSPQIEEAIGYLDQEMGKIWDAIQYREKNFKEDWLMIITTDHGRDANTGRNHGGQSERERTTWMVSNLKNTNAYWQFSNPAIVDILPTIARFQKIELPKSHVLELDGVPMTGAISVSHPSLVLQRDSLVLGWKSYAKKGKLKIQLSQTNHFKKGGEDQYQTIANLPQATERFAMKIDSMQNSYFKFVLQGENNSVNIHWGIFDPKK